MNIVHNVTAKYDSPEYRAAQMHLTCIEITNDGAVFTDWGTNKTWHEYTQTVTRLQEADAERNTYGVRQEL